VLEDEGNTFHRNVGKLLPDYTSSYVNLSFISPRCPGYTATNGGMTDELMIMWMNRQWSNSRHELDIHFEGLRKVEKTLSKDFRCFGRDSNKDCKIQGRTLGFAQSCSVFYIVKSILEILQYFNCSFIIIIIIIIYSSSKTTALSSREGLQAPTTRRAILAGA
jgi:hypothetical protein